MEFLTSEASSRTQNQIDLTINMDENNKIFVNKSLKLEDIKFFGFDMDYTLAEYKSPNFEIMVYELLVAKMVELGYPVGLANIKYDCSFPIRGLWVDKKLGNLLKTDSYGNIFLAFHGFEKLSDTEISAQYPNHFIEFDTSRVMTTDTWYSLPEIFLISATISYLESNENSIKEGSVETINYSQILKDIRHSMDYVHVTDNKMKQNIVNNVQKYVKRSRKLPQMMSQLKFQGAKVFLITNSDYEYTKAICQYIFFCSNENINQWKTYFDYIIVNAKKPLFFHGGTVMKKVIEDCTPVKLEEYNGPLEQGCVYVGGSAELFTQLIQANGKQILYFGDHIYGDVLISKKVKGWNTCLIAPEIEYEIEMWKNKYLVDSLKKLEYKMGNLESGSQSCSEICKMIKKIIKQSSKSMSSTQGPFGSLFSCGDRRTFFGEQSINYADIYTSSCLNLVYYTNSHVFRSPFLSMPHELLDSLQVEKALTDSLGLENEIKMLRF